MACRMPIDPRTHKESLLARRVLEGEVSEDDVYNSLVPYVARSSSVQASAWVPYYFYTPLRQLLEQRLLSRCAL